MKKVKKVKKVKIFYIVKNINKVPSCQYNILMLKSMGYEVIAILGESTVAIDERLNESNIYSIKFEKKHNNNLRFFIEFRRFVCNYIKHTAMQEDIIFFGTADTAICLVNTLKKRKKVVCIKELYDHDKWYYKQLLKKICKNSTAVVACEKNRARYMKFEWGLDEKPFVLSNRPFYNVLPKKSLGTTEKNREIISYIKNLRPIIYQANHIHYTPELINLATALKQINQNYLLVLVGNINNKADIKKIREIYDKVFCTGYILSPLHMEITSNAYIGVTIYQDNSLNNLFCAPNKIFEYACCGVPTLANDVPGLVESVAVHHTGICVNWNNIDEIEKAIRDIDNDYDNYRKQSLIFYLNSDNREILNEIIEYVQKKGEKTND